MPKEKKCLHKSIIQTVKNRYSFPKGWDWYQETDEEIDLEDYLVERDTETPTYFCEDCGEYLE